jgi:hypothetical protein
VSKMFLVTGSTRLVLDHPNDMNLIPQLKIRKKPFDFETIIGVVGADLNDLRRVGLTNDRLKRTSIPTKLRSNAIVDAPSPEKRPSRK